MLQNFSSQGSARLVELKAEGEQRSRTDELRKNLEAGRWYSACNVGTIC